MENTGTPFHQRISHNLISIAIVLAILYLGRDILVPVFFAFLLAALLLPAINFLKRKHWPDPLAILVSLVSFITIALCVVFFLSYKVINFFDDLPEIQEKIGEMLTSLQQWINSAANVTVREQNQYFQDFLKNLQERSSEYLRSTFTTIADLVTYAVLLPIYTFLALFYRSTIKRFLVLTFNDNSNVDVRKVLDEATHVAGNYVLGLGIQTTVVFALNTIGFLIIGIEYVVFLALLAALLNLIPYVGMLTANIISMLITLMSSGNPIDMLWVGVVLAIVQVIDNNITMPLIVGNSVRVNAFFTLLGVIVGGTLGGIPGMFLAIPGLAVLKVIFDNVPQLKAWGILLSDQRERRKPPRILRRKGKAKSKEQED